MPNGGERIPLIDSATLHHLQKEIMQAGTRFELDQITRRLWRTYGDDLKNKLALGQLRKAIESKRDLLKRNDPR